MSKHVLQQVIEDAGYEVRAYGGRAMHGKSCVATDPGPNVFAFIADLVSAASGDPAALDAVEEALRVLRTGQTGQGLVAYFPDVPFAGGDDDACDVCGKPCSGKQCCDDCAELEVKP